MSVLLPSSRLAIIRNRLLVDAVNRAPVDIDTDVLEFVSDGHRDIAERLSLLERFSTIALLEGVAEYALPADTYQVLGVYWSGVRLEPIPDRLAASDLSGVGYYSRTGLLGLAQAPIAAGTLYVHISSVPPALADWDNDELTAFGQEWDHLLVDYATWRIYLLGADAADIRYAEFRRQSYEAGVASIAARGRVISQTTPQRIETVTVTDWSALNAS